MAYVVWRHIGTRLSVTTDIVGSTTFTDFDSYRYIYRFYDVTLVLPAATALLYMVLSRFGPLRADPPNRWPPQLEELEPTLGDVHESELTLGESGHTVGQDLLWALTRVALVALTVGIEANVARSVHLTVLTRFGLAAGILYAIAVGFATMALRLWRKRTSPVSDPGARVNTKSAWTYRSFLLDLSVVNAFASVVVIPLLVLVSSSTTVTIAGNGTVVHYTWFPAWLGALTTTVVVILLIFAHLHARFSVRAATSSDRCSLSSLRQSSSSWSLRVLLELRARFRHLTTRKRWWEPSSRSGMDCGPGAYSSASRLLGRRPLRCSRDVGAVAHQVGCECRSIAFRRALHDGRAVCLYRLLRQEERSAHRGRDACSGARCFPELGWDPIRSCYRSF